jgi:REP element-mobilizing transposase RayT
VDVIARGLTPVFPLAYFITFSCYGARLHGDERGSVDREHNAYGTPFLPADPERLREMAARMKESPYSLDLDRRRLICPAVVEVAAHRGWMLAAVHVRTAHVHAVVHAQVDPDQIIKDFKAYSTRAIHRGGLDARRKRLWSFGGSHPYLWTADAVRAAIHYVLDEQGERMETYEAIAEDLRALLG